MAKQTEVSGYFRLKLFFMGASKWPKEELVIGWTPGPWVLQFDFTEKEHTAGSISNFYIYCLA